VRAGRIHYIVHGLSAQGRTRNTREHFDEMHQERAGAVRRNAREWPPAYGAGVQRVRQCAGYGRGVRGRGAGDVGDGQGREGGG
jgi:hypothetical protein